MLQLSLFVSIGGTRTCDLVSSRVCALTVWQIPLQKRLCPSRYYKTIYVISLNNRPIFYPFRKRDVLFQVLPLFGGERGVQTEPPAGVTPARARGSQLRQQNRHGVPNSLPRCVRRVQCLLLVLLFILRCWRRIFPLELHVLFEWRILNEMYVYHKESLLRLVHTEWKRKRKQKWSMKKRQTSKEISLLLPLSLFVSRP